MIPVAPVSAQQSILELLEKAIWEDMAWRAACAAVFSSADKNRTDARRMEARQRRQLANFRDLVRGGDLAGLREVEAKE